MKGHYILGVHVTDRTQKASDVQQLLTDYGCNIRTRIGLHDVSGEYCSPSGIILLELAGEECACQELADKLTAIEGVEVQKMFFGG